MASEKLEVDEGLGECTIDVHRAIASLMEEFEAVDWYNQRAAATSDESLREVLEHNRDEEKEHAAMALEWLRRTDPVLDRHLRTYLFTEGSLIAIEEQDAVNAPAERTTNSASLGIGSLKGEPQQ